MKFGPAIIMAVSMTIIGIGVGILEGRDEVNRDIGIALAAHKVACGPTHGVWVWKPTNRGGALDTDP